jgi:hypothetical protein
MSSQNTATSYSLSCARPLPRTKGATTIHVLEHLFEPRTDPNPQRHLLQRLLAWSRGDHRGGYIPNHRFQQRPEQRPRLGNESQDVQEERELVARKSELMAPFASGCSRRRSHVAATPSLGLPMGLPMSLRLARRSAMSALRMTTASAVAGLVVRVSACRGTAMASVA